MAQSPTIRIATLRDAPALAALGRETFADTFGHLYRAADLELFLDDHHAQSVYETLITSPLEQVWIAEDAGGQPIGYAVAGAVALPVQGLALAGGEVKRLYVRRDWQRGGLGRTLLELSLSWLEEEGFAPLYLGVWSDNFRAQRLYARYGFSKIGEYEFPVGAHRDREFIFRRAVAPAQVAAE